VTNIRVARPSTVALLAAAFFTVQSCHGDNAEAKPSGFVDPGWIAGRKLEYLKTATRSFEPSNVPNVIAHLERSRIDHTYSPAGVVPLDAWDGQLEMMSNLVDGRDFEALYLLHVVLAYRESPMLETGLVEKVEQGLLAFKYWYTQPTAQGAQDSSYYWSENHQVVYDTIEYLVGAHYAGAALANDGRTGAAHAVEARDRLLAWFAARSRFGFSEWHSNVYYQKDIVSLLALVDFAVDEDIRVLAASTLDVLFFDLALHNEQAAFGVTHGRSYKKNKLTSLDEDTWNLTKLVFDNTAYDYQRADNDPGGVLMARSERYQLPEAIRRVGISNDTFVDRERMGIATNELGPPDPQIQAPYGLSYSDPALVDLWWGMNAFITWPTVPITLQAMDTYGLWDNPQLASLQVLRPFAGDPLTAMFIASSVAPMADLFFLNEVNTYTWRSPDVMLSSAIDYRKGLRGAQVHSWQATLDANAVVFTNHPATPLAESTDWLDDPEDGGYWNGEATLPRSAQQENVGIYIYAPQYPEANPPPLDVFTYQPMTHAYFPQDRFDEVVREGNWTFGRLGDGYVALFSYRPAEFLVYDPTRNATGGHTLPFDLVAAGGADNVWIVECASRSTAGSFASFRRLIQACPVQVTTRGPSSNGISPGYDVVYDSPSQGRMTFGWEAPFTVRSRPISLGSFSRYDNPWVRTAFTSQTVDIRRGPYGVTLDFAGKTRTVDGPGR
jgi:hypothetical protein